jgi:hypothetical protein
VAWGANEAGFTFISDPPATSKTVFAEMRCARNGSIFSVGRTPEGSTALDAVALEGEILMNASTRCGGFVETDRGQTQLDHPSGDPFLEKVGFEAPAQPPEQAGAYVVIQGDSETFIDGAGI